MDLFRVRLNCIDSYQTLPTKFDRHLRDNDQPSLGHIESKVPVIRVFGSTETGQKVCAHVHGAFPYLYIEYAGSLAPDEVAAYTQRLHLSIDHALAFKYKRDLSNGNAKFVARITLVKGVPFYGFHVGYKYYLKIYMLDPTTMTRLADLLRQGAILNKTFQPFEAHLQYLLQWMVDYNLYGCGYIDCNKVIFRSPVPKYDELANKSHLWHDRCIPDNVISRDSELPRASHCSVEVDLCVQDIINRQDITSRPLHHDFIEHLVPLDADMKFVPSMANLWKDESRRQNLRASDTKRNSSLLVSDSLITMSADSRNLQPSGWIHEGEYRGMATALIAEEKSQSDGADISFSTFVMHDEFEPNIKTTLEAVEDLFPHNFKPAPKVATEPCVGHGNARNSQDDTDIGQKRILALNSNRRDEFYHGPPRGIVPESSYNDNSETDHPIDTVEFAEPRSERRKKDLKRVAYLDDQANIHSKRRRVPSGRQTEYSELFVPTGQTVGPDHNRSPNDDCSSTKALGNGSSLNALATEHGGTTWGTLSSRHSFTAQEVPRTQPLKISIAKGLLDLDTALSPSRSNFSQPNGSKRSQSVRVHESPMTFLNAPNLDESPTLDDLSRSLRLSRPMSNSNSLGNVKGRSEPRDGRTALFIFVQRPPSYNSVASTIPNFDCPQIIHQDAFYGNETDVPGRACEWAGKEFKFTSPSIHSLPEFDPTGNSRACCDEKPIILMGKPETDRTQQKSRLRSWEIAGIAPSYVEVLTWSNERIVYSADKLRHNASSPAHIYSLEKHKVSQVEGPTQKDKHGFKYTQVPAISSAQPEAQCMSVMSLEIHVNTRASFVPNPEEDEIQCLFWCWQSDEHNFENDNTMDGTHSGVIVLSGDDTIARKIGSQLGVKIREEPSELDLIIRIAEIVRDFDPDMLTGFEVHSSSWGYLIDRARLIYDYDLCAELSRMKVQPHGRPDKHHNEWGSNNTTAIKVTGRHIINIWRAMRNEVNLLQYTLENIAFHILHRRIPHFTSADLTMWYMNGKAGDLVKVITYYISRVYLNLEILDQNGLVSRTIEQARLLGVDFSSVFSRGSQFKVESLMFRISKPENFLLISPSRKQIGEQNALECLPLVMEPQCAFYTSPLLVLDFQSLYPSVIIAYNYCYSTFLGRIVNWRGRNKMGFTEFKRQQRLVELLKDHINIAPNGIMYAKPQIRRSLLAKMLSEILETRVMVKSGLKNCGDDKSLRRLLNNRQLALKLIANVTYGYTSASFSGRMPCSEIADSIVQTARETLEKAIALIHSVKRWGAEVVYGDTDSLFVYLKGRTKDQAFDIGEEIATAVTSINPRPVKLKFEKVYSPCVLLAKKRYVGFQYESRTQDEPVFDAKGIETVRRDGTRAEQLIEEKALKILFHTSDLSQVKRYFQNQCEKIMKGSVSIQDFCFAREVKLGTYSKTGPPPPGALISTKRMLVDPRAEPQYGERVRYVVITGAPGARLIDRCVAPEELLDNDSNELDSEYYISKNIIPPLERIFNLVGASVRSWYEEMPKVHRVRRVDANGPLQAHHREHGTTLESYMKSSSCLVCREKVGLDGPLCARCVATKPLSLLSLRTRLSNAERRFLDVQKICQSCSGISPLDEVKCDSKDCPVFYTRTKQKARLRMEQAAIEPVMGEIIRDLEW